MVALKDAPAEYQDRIKYEYWENVCNGKHEF